MNGTMTKESSFVKNRAKMFACRSEEEVIVTADCKSPKTPSYVSLSCAVSGYSGLRYDSRTRDPSRDRPSLPLCMARSRDSSPNFIKANCSVPQSPGFTVSEISETDRAPPIHHQIRSKSVDRGYLRQNFLNPHMQQSGKPPSGVTVTYKTTFSTMVNGGSCNGETPVVERGRNRIRSSTVPHEIGLQDSKSVIQQKIERLYGPAALARGFFLVKSPVKPGSNINKKEPVAVNGGIHLNNNSITQEMAGSSDCSTPPVFRHLNAEFRQQLCLKKRSPSIEHSKSPVIAKEPVSPASPSEQIVVTNKSNGSPTTPTNGVQSSCLEDGHKFLRILDEERKRIECLIAKNEIYLLEPTVKSSEELTGKIHAAVGKAKLLLAQKFEQFAGLCHKNLTQNADEPFPTTGQDLAGFWDMVMIQVDHIKTLFAEIQQMRDNGWVEAVPEKTPVVKNVKKNRPSPAGAATPVPRSAKAEEAARAREEARRKMMEEKRKLMKARKSDEAENWTVISERPESNPVDEEAAVV